MGIESRHDDASPREKIVVKEGIQAEISLKPPETDKEARAIDVQNEIDAINRSVEDAKKRNELLVKMGGEPDLELERKAIEGLTMKKLVSLGTDQEELNWRAKSRVLTGGERESDLKTSEQQERFRQNMLLKVGEMAQDTANVINGLPPELQEQYAERYFNDTFKDGNPSQNALGAYQRFFKKSNSPFAAKYRQLALEHYSKKGREGDAIREIDPDKVEINYSRWS